MKLHPTPLPGLTGVETTPVVDDRGRFVRAYCEQELAALLGDLHIRQINVSTTVQRGTVRGMHFQLPPFAEVKLIRCLRGTVFDVAVDLRPDSPTFLRWHGVELTADGSTQICIPPGFAHGFQALSDDVQLLYLHTNFWSRDHERRLRPDDPRLAIAWPLPIAMMSEKDSSAPLLDDSFAGVRP
jgi:dTDP-4-dehydrorhamnose 3,5-epimerase